MEPGGIVVVTWANFGLYLKIHIKLSLLTYKTVLTNLLSLGESNLVAFLSRHSYILHITTLISIRKKRRKERREVDDIINH